MLQSEFQHLGEPLLKAVGETEHQESSGSRVTKYQTRIIQSTLMHPISIQFGRSLPFFDRIYWEDKMLSEQYDRCRTESFLQQYC